MIHIDKEGLVVQFCDSAWEAVQYIRSTEVAPWMIESRIGGVIVPKKTGSMRPVMFNDNDAMLGTGGVDLPKAMKLVEEGWEEGLSLIHHGLQAILEYNAPGINRWRHDVAGEQPDIARFLGGDPRDMHRRAFFKGSKPIIHMVVNTALHGGATPRQVMNYGVGLVGLVDYLESRGKRVELDRLGVVYGGFGDKRSMQGWKVKRAEEPLDLASVAFALAHPASHRRLVWAMRERGLGFRSHGAPASINENDAKLIGSEGAFIIDSVGTEGSHCDSPQSALLLAAKRLNKAAGEELVDLKELEVRP